jgi:hypothetical protein
MIGSFGERKIGSGRGEREGEKLVPSFPPSFQIIWMLFKD